MVGSAFSEPLQNKMTSDNIFDHTSDHSVDTKVKIDIDSDFSGCSNIRAVLKTGDNETLKDKILEFYLDDKKIGTQRTDSNGLASIGTIHGDLNKGSHNLRVEFRGDAQYNPSTDNITLNLTKEILNISVTDVGCIYAESPVITVKLTNSTKKPVSDKQIVFSFVENDTYITDATSDINGRISFNLVQKQYLKPGKYLIRAKFKGDEKYYDGINTFILTVNKMNATIAFTQITTVAGNNYVIQSQLIGSNRAPPGTPIFGQNITFYYANGTIIGSKDVSFKGYVDYHYIFQDKGNFTIIAESEGNEYYNPTKTRTTAIVYGKRTKIDMIKIFRYSEPLGKKVKLKAYLKDNLTNETISDRPITFFGTNNERIGTNNTDSDGCAQIEYTVPSQKGNYMIQSSFNPSINDVYSSSNGVSKVIIEDMPDNIKKWHDTHDGPPKKPYFLQMSMEMWRNFWGYYD